MTIIGKTIVAITTRHKRKRRAWPMLLCLLSVLLHACAPDDDTFIGQGYHNFTAYFNAYYNAKIEFEKGLKALEADPALTTLTGLEIFPPVSDKSPGQEFFSNVIAKTSDILKSHPLSDLADDALLLMGKSYYHKAEFQSAGRKFQEILTNYPDSDLLDETSFWYGRTLLRELSIAQAREVFQSVVASPKAHEEVKALCRFSLAELAIKESDYQDAITQIEAALPADTDDNIRSRAAFTLARLYNLQEDYAKAAKAYQQVLDLNPTYELRYSAMIGYAITLRENGRFKKSAEVLDEMLGDDKNLERFGDIRYELATTYAHQNKVNEAVDLYLEIIRRHPKTESSAKSYYQLGLLSRDVMRDFRGAKAFFDSSRVEYSRGQIGQLATEAGSATVRLLNLYETVSALDSTIRLGIVKKSPETAQKPKQVKLPGASQIQKPEAPRQRTRKDYRKSEFLARGGKDAFRETAVSQTPATVRPTFSAATDSLTLMRYRKDLIVKKAAIGNYFHVSQPVPDSAIYWYKQTLANIKSVQPIPYDSLREQVRQVNEVVLFSLADIYRTTGDSASAKLAYRKLLDEFPNSAYINVARSNLGLPRLSKQEHQSDKMMYMEAYAYLDRKNPKKALAQLQQLIRTYPRSSLLPKAMLSVGFIYETYLGQRDSAFAAYQRLRSRFANSPEAKSVEDKVKAVLDYRAGMSVPQQSAPKDTPVQMPDAQAVPSGFTRKVDLKKRGYSISIGSFPDKALAEEFAEDYAKKGITVTLWEVEVSGKIYHRVLVGSFSNQDDAEAAIRKNRSVLPQDAFSVKIN